MIILREGTGASFQPRPQGFSLKNGWFSRPTHFLREKPWERGWPVSRQIRTFFSRVKWSQSLSKALGLQKRPLLPLFRRPVKVAATFEVAMWCSLGDALCKKREIPERGCGTGDWNGSNFFSILSFCLTMMVMKKVLLLHLAKSVDLTQAKQCIKGLNKIKIEMYET